MALYAEAVSSGRQTWKPLRETLWRAEEQEANEGGETGTEGTESEVRCEYLRYTGCP